MRGLILTQWDFLDLEVTKSGKGREAQRKIEFHSVPQVKLVMQNLFWRNKNGA